MTRGIQLQSGHAFAELLRLSALTGKMNCNYWFWNLIMTGANEVPYLGPRQEGKAVQQREVKREDRRAG